MPYQKTLARILTRACSHGSTGHAPGTVLTLYKQCLVQSSRRLYEVGVIPSSLRRNRLKDMKEPDKSHTRQNQVPTQVLSISKHSKLGTQRREEFWAGKWDGHICFKDHSDDYSEETKERWRGKEKGKKKKGSHWKCQGEEKRLHVEWWQDWRRDVGVGNLVSSSNWTDGVLEARERVGSHLGFCLGQLDQMTCFYPS